MVTENLHTVDLEDTDIAGLALGSCCGVINR